MDHAYADVNGVRLHYVTVARGPLVMFLHGFPQFWYAWTAQLAHFGRDHRAGAPAMGGNNPPPRPTQPPPSGRHHPAPDLRAAAAHPGRSTSRPAHHAAG